MDKTPDPGYFVKNKVFAKELIKNGFIKLNEEVAKEYGEPFYLSSLKLGEKPNKKINYYDNIINSNEIMEDHYDSTLILEILDKDENKLYTFYDLLYSTCNTLNDANNNYDKLYSIIHASDNEEDIINTIINAQN
mgnify:FL=1